MQLTATYPESFAPEPRIAAVEREQARRAREIAVKEAAAEIRAQIADKRAQVWWDRLQDILGPEPTTAEGWWSRRMKVLEFAQIEGVGLSVNGVKNYADECKRNAEVMEPAKYGPKASLNLGLTPTLEALLDQIADSRQVSAPIDVTPPAALREPER